MPESANNDPATPVTPDAAQTSLSQNSPDESLFSTPTRVGSAIGAAVVGSVGAFGASPKDVQAHDPSVAEGAAQAFANRIGVIEQDTSDFGTRPASENIDGVRLEISQFSGVAENPLISSSNVTGETVTGPDITPRIENIDQTNPVEQVEASTAPAVIAEIAKPLEYLSTNPENIFGKASVKGPNGNVILKLRINRNGQIEKSSYDSQKGMMTRFSLVNPLSAQGVDPFTVMGTESTTNNGASGALAASSTGETVVVVGQRKPGTQYPDGSWDYGNEGKIAISKRGGAGFEVLPDKPDGAYTEVKRGTDTKFFAHFVPNLGGVREVHMIDTVANSVTKVELPVGIYNAMAVTQLDDGNIRIAGPATTGGIFQGIVDPDTNTVVRSNTSYPERDLGGGAYWEKVDTATGNAIEQISVQNVSGSIFFDEPGLNKTTRKHFSDYPFDPAKTADYGGGRRITAALRDKAGELILVNGYLTRSVNGEPQRGRVAIQVNNGTKTIVLNAEDATVEEKSVTVLQKDVTVEEIVDENGNSQEFLGGIIRSADGRTNLGEMTYPLDESSDEAFALVRTASTATATPTPSATPSASATPSVTPEPEHTSTPTATPTPSATPSASATPSPTVTASPIGNLFRVYLPSVIRKATGW